MKSLSQIAHERLYPSLRDPNYLVLSARRRIFTQWIAQLDGTGLRLLDVGGRYQPYRPLFDGRISQYVAVDIARSELVTLVADGEALPFPPQCFDIIVITQAMDYLSDPLRAVRQFHELLKPGGTLLASIPSFAPAFDESEKWRFTKAGLKSLFNSFASVDIIPEVSSIGGLLRGLNLGIQTFLRFDALRSLYTLTICPVINLAAIAVEGLKPTRNDQFCANYSVRARKA